MIRLRLPNEILKEIDFVYMSYYNFEKLLSINNTSTRIHYYRPIKSRGKFTVYFLHLLNCSASANEEQLIATESSWKNETFNQDKKG